MAWILLMIAGLLEIGWVIGMKYAQGFSRLWPSVATIGMMAASFLLLSQAMRSIPLGTAYAIWTGIGAAGAAIAGILLFGESKEFIRLFCVGLIIAGVIGLKMTSSAS